MFTFTSLLPKSLLTTVAQGVTERYQRWCRITDETLDMAEAELAQRREFTGIVAPAAAKVVMIETEEESEPRRRRAK